MTVALFVALVAAASDWTYERAAVWDSTHRNRFRAPACAIERCEVEGTTYRLETLVRLHHATAAYVLGLSSSLPASPTTGDFYTVEEAAYLSELRQRTFTGFVIAAFGATALAVLLARARETRRQVAVAAATSGLIGIGLLAATVVNPEWPTADARALPLLSSGGGTFGPIFNIHQLYPANFGATLGRQAALTLLAIATACGAATAFSLRSHNERRPSNQG